MPSPLFDGLRPALKARRVQLIEFALAYVEIQVADGRLYDLEKGEVDAFVVEAGELVAEGRAGFQINKLICEVSGTSSLGGIGAALSAAYTAIDGTLATTFVGLAVFSALISASALFGRRKAEVGLTILPRIATLREKGLSVLAERAAKRRAEGDV